MNSRQKKKQAAKKKTNACWVPSGHGPSQVCCSGCGFRTETARAVETGWSATEHIGVKYRFCPSCGAAMVIRPRTGKAT